MILKKIIKALNKILNLIKMKKHKSRIASLKENRLDLILAINNFHYKDKKIKVQKKAH